MFTQQGAEQANPDRDATLFALANGALGVRGGVDELSYDTASYLPDAFVRRPIAYHERFSGFANATDTRLACPSAVSITVFIDGVQIDFASAQILFFKRQIDFTSGVLHRVTRWQLSDGRMFEIIAERFVPVGAGAIAISRISLTPLNFGAHISIALPITLSAERASLTGVNDPRISAKASDALYPVQTTVEDNSARALFACHGDDIHIAVAQYATSQHLQNAVGETVQQVAAKRVAGEPLHFVRFVAFAVDREGGAQAMAEAGAVALAASKDGFAALAERHAAALAAFWSSAAISIPGDPELARAIRFNLFHLFQSASRSDDFSIAAKGLTGEGYEGHYFWDTEAFVLPTLALTAPELARHILMCRVAGLDKARAHARHLNHASGALFPWRTISGDECSAHYPTGSAQYHINAAIAFAIEVYVAATGDQDFLIQHGAALLFETARIWLDVGHFSDRRDGAFVIHGVTGPDEYSALVDNDYYTNALAQRHLRFAVKTAHMLANQVDSGYALLASELGLDGLEIEHWEAAATRMYLPVDPVLGVSPQDDAFLGKPKFDLAAHAGEARPLLLHHHPMTLFRHQLCKQGDVVQAMVMAGDAVPLMLKRRNFDYYEPLTTHDSTLSATAFAILAAEIGEDAKALAYHRQTAFVDIDDNHGNTGHGAHMAAMAGSWLTLVQGWAGLRIEDGALFLKPRCLGGMGDYSFNIRWCGSLIAITVESNACHYRIIDGNPVTLFDHARPVSVTSDGIRIAQPEIKAVIFDLDGVLTDTAQTHYQAWKRMCDEDGLALDLDINEKLKGVDRAKSLQIILDHAGHTVSPAEFGDMTARKNGYYRELIAAYTPADLFDGVPHLLQLCRRAGLKIGLASASRNATELVERLGIAGQFDHTADANLLARSKPDPEIFLTTAQALGVAPEVCVGVEDAVAGIAAIRAASMHAIGVGDAAILADADIVVASISNISAAMLLQSSRLDEDCSAVTQAIRAKPVSVN
jgi:beta-phosphoglucomutase